MHLVAEGSQVACIVRRFLEPAVNERAHSRLYRLERSDQNECGDDKRHVAFLTGHCNEDFLA